MTAEGDIALSGSSAEGKVCTSGFCDSGQTLVHVYDDTEGEALMVVALFPRLGELCLQGGSNSVFLLLNRVRREREMKLFRVTEELLGFGDLWKVSVTYQIVCQADMTVSVTYQIVCQTDMTVSRCVLNVFYFCFLLFQFSKQTILESYLSFVENYNTSGKVIENALTTKSSMQKFIEVCGLIIFTCAQNCTCFALFSCMFSFKTLHFC